MQVRKVDPEIDVEDMLDDRSCRRAAPAAAAKPVWCTAQRVIPQKAFGGERRHR
jgi:hypothetical protein